MSDQKFLPGIVTGYKATDRDMKCRDFQFELGKWYQHGGEIELCESGFHFCEQPSGPWSYYSEEDTRVFKVEAEFVLDSKFEPGADFKRVAKRIRLTEEVEFTGNRNTGHCNTGHCNTGNRNTGNWNTGNSNTGNRNTGNRNTGHCNTGNRNTGDWNATNNSSGFFCVEEPKVICFDIQTEFSRDEFFDQFPEVFRLGEELQEIFEIDFNKYKNLPGITPEKLKVLHNKHLEGKKT